MLMQIITKRKPLKNTAFSAIFIYATKNSEFPILNKI